MADRYWNPSAAGNWGDTSSWAATDGGATGESVPTSSDDVYFTSTNSYKCTVNVQSNCAALDFTGFTGEFSFTNNIKLYIYGDLTLSGSANYNPTTSGNQFWYMVPTSGTTLLTTNGALIGKGYLYIDAGTATVSLQDNLDFYGTSWYTRIRIRSGTFTTNNNDIKVAYFEDESGAYTRTLNLGSSTLTIMNTFMLQYSLTVNAGTSIVKLYQGSGSTQYFGTGLNDIEILGNNNLNCKAFTCVNLTIDNGSNYVEYSFEGNVTVTDTLTFTGNSDRYRLLIVSNTPGTQRTLTAATVSAQYCDFRDIKGAGAGSWDLSAITGGSGNCGGNSDITFSTARDLYWVGNGGTTYDTTHWASSSGGAGSAGVPRAQDTLHFDSNSFSSASQTVAIGLRSHGTMDWTGVTNSPTVNFNFVSSYYGSMTLVSGMSVTGTSAIYFRGRSSHTITTAGKSFGSSIFSFSGLGGTYTLQDSLTNDGTIYLQYGTLDANDFDVTCQVFNSNYNGNTRVLNMGSGTWTVTSTSYVWYIHNTGLTLNEETSTIKATNNSSTAKSFRAGTAQTYYNIWIATLGTGTFDFYDASAHVFNQIKISEGAIVRFKAGYTITVSDFVADGTSAITISSSTSATHTLSCASGTIDVSYCTISYSIATGGATWNAWTSQGNTDGGNNTGWVFTEPGGAVVYNAFWFGG